MHLTLFKQPFAIVSVGLLFGLLSPSKALPQTTCTSFWVNPQTGKQECLGAGATNTSPAQNEVVTESTTVSSDAVNQPYSGQAFNMLPLNQLRTRLPVDSVKALLSVSANNSLINGTPGVAPSSDQPPKSNQGISPQAFKTSGFPFSTSRVLGGTTNPAQANPYSRAGKLYMAFGGSTYNYICSAALIGRSLLLTAAHCVHNYGKGNAGFATKVMFIPAQDNSSSPYRLFESTQFLIPTPYFDGTDTCIQTGVVCNNDVALVALNNNAIGQQAGELAGWFGYGWNGYSYTIPASDYRSVFGDKAFVSLTQLGYPGEFDSGVRMQLNTAYGAIFTSGDLKNTWLGSAMTGGSSGGPWIVNFGEDAAGATYGSGSNRNVVVGVTSYGDTEARMGSSFFGQNKEYPAADYGGRGAGNIGKLVYDACDNPAVSGWRLKSRGRC